MTSLQYDSRHKQWQSKRDWKVISVFITICSQMIVTLWLYYKATVKSSWQNSAPFAPDQKMGHIKFTVTCFPRHLTILRTVRFAYVSRCFHILVTCESRSIRVNISVLYSDVPAVETAYSFTVPSWIGERVKKAVERWEEPGKKVKIYCKLI